MKMLVAERELISRLLRQSILTLCRETMSQYKLEVDGIVCISLENDAHPIVIKVHEQIENDFGSSNLWTLNNSKNSNSLLKLEHNSYEYNNTQCNELKERLLNDSPKLKDFATSDDDLDTSDGFNPYKNSMKLGFLAATRGKLNSSAIQRKSKPNKIDTNLMDEQKSSSPMLDGYSDKNKFDDDLNDSSAFQVPDDDSPSSTLPLPETVPEILPTVSRPGIPNTIHAQSAALSHPDGYVCKRCFQILPDTGAFESHNLRVHSLFTCRTCFRGFTARNNLKRHIRLHTGVKPYKCQICNQGFTRKDDLKGHELRHSYKKPFRCSICKKGYTDRSCVRNHMAKEHNTRLTNVCPKCGEGFNDTEAFTEHKKTHPEFNDYQCAECDFIGVNGLMYIKHLLTHQTKVFSCKPCQQSFKDPFDYTDHLKLHRSDESFKAYICCFCGSCQHTYDQFVRHEHSHAQMKNHACTVCSKSFLYPSSLKDHMSTHNRSEEDDSSDYWCTECQTGFATEDNLEDHILTTHEAVGEQLMEESLMDTMDPNFPEADDSFPMASTMQESTEDSREITEHPPPEPDEPESDLEILQRSYISLQKPPSIIPMKNRSIGGRNKSPLSPLGSFSPNISLRNLSSALANKMASSAKSPSQVSSMVLAPFPQDFTLDGDASTSYSNTSVEGGKSFKNSLGASNDVAGDLNRPIKEEPGSYENGSEDSGIQGLKEDSMDGTDNKDMMVLEKVQIRSPGFERVFTPSFLFKSNPSFECLECGKVYTDFGQFESHSAILHRRFLCEFCGKIFTAKPNRDRHLRYHTGERPYKCGLCEATFFRGDDLKYHRTTKHATVKPFNCNVCGLTFAWPKDLQRHRKQKKHFV